MLTHMAKALHLLQDSVHIRHHVFTLHHDGGVRAVPQGGVENSSTLQTNTYTAQLYTEETW